jgi:hypothetical protein
MFQAALGYVRLFADSCRTAVARLFGVLLLGGTLLGLADVPSGLQAGSSLPALPAYGVIGLVEGKEVDFVQQRRDALTVYVFVPAEDNGIPKGGRPVARFLKTLDEEIGRWNEAAVVAIWLGEKAFQQHQEYLPRFQQSVRLSRTSLAAYAGEPGGPPQWGIHPQATLTVVVAHRGRVVRTLSYDSVQDTDVPAVIEVLKQLEKK